MKAIFTVGCSASGKSTFAKTLPTWSTVIIERDECRREILRQANSYDRGDLWIKWKFKNEKLVNQVVEQLQADAVREKKDIIFSDTWLNQGRLSAKIEEMKSLGYEIEVKYFKVPAIDILYKQNMLRVEPVPEKVIREQWCRWLTLGEAVTGIKSYVPDTTKPKAICVDIDGTVARMVDRGPFDWDKVDTDEPRTEIIDMVKRYKDTHKIIFLSGRDSVCRDKTEEWLNKYYGEVEYLYMRPVRDFSPDREVKNKLFFDYVAPHYNVDFVIDDRRQMIHHWTDIGVNCINVGSPYLDF